MKTINYRLSNVGRYRLLSILTMLGILCSVAFFFQTAFAGVGVGVTPSFPLTVNVGANNVPVTLAITNNSDSGDGDPLTLTNIKMIPSCGAISGTTCSTSDTGVFQVDVAGTGAGACAVNTFTIAETNAGTGEVTFTPNATISLTPGQTCTINFTVDVVGAPDTDASGAVGLQTLQLANVSGIDQLQQPGSGFGSDTTTVNKQSPTIATVPTPASGPIGTVLNDTATLSGGFNPTGNVTFKLFAPTDATCSGTAVYTNTDSSSPYATTPGYTSLVAGTYHWTADYAGDANNVATSSGCQAEPVTVNAASPTIATVPTPASGPVGTVLNDTATLSGGSNPTGNVTFKLFPPADLTCSGTAVYSEVDPSAPYATTPGYTSLVAGVYHWTADYAGDANNVVTSSGCAAEPVTVSALKGHIIVDKVTNPAGTSTSFFFDATGTGYTDFSLTDAAAPNNQELDAGSYSVAEINLPANWTPGTTTCVSSILDTETPGNLELDAGETITCTFHNTYTPPQVVQYCSPGYWKQPQHFDSWIGYTPNQLFSSVFEGVTISWSAKGKPGPVANPTLLQVLEGNGGGITSLARAAVGALLNATALNSGLTAAQVTAIFNAANPSGDLEAAKAQYTFPENCPLN